MRKNRRWWLRPMRKSPIFHTDGRVAGGKVIVDLSEGRGMLPLSFPD